jgi:hypothetical protein
VPVSMSLDKVACVLPPARLLPVVGKQRLF